MLDDQTNGGLLQLGKEDLAGVLYQRHRQLKGSRHVRNDLVVALITHRTGYKNHKGKKIKGTLKHEHRTKLYKNTKITYRY